MRRALCLAFLGLLLSIPELARASHGGPELCDVVGWDPVDQKVFVVHSDWSEAGTPPQLAYFDLKAKDPCRRVAVPWWKLDKSVREQRWKALRKRLQPLELHPAVLRPQQEVLATDTLTSPSDSHFRYRVSVNLGQRLDVTTYGRPDVSTLRLYLIPGRQEMLAILSFIGIPFEGGYESQVPVLLKSTCAEPLKVEWKRDEWDP